MRVILTLAWRDLRGSRSGLRLLAICLFLGVATLAAIGSLTASILGEISSRGQSILGGDLQMEAVQRKATDEELAAFAKTGRVSETIRMRAMAALPDRSTSVLAELKGVDAAYPLYGQFKLKPGAIAPRPDANSIAIAPGLAEKLDLKIGSQLRFGEAVFKVIGIIDEEPDRVGEGFTLGPVAITSLEGVATTRLVQPGSLYTMRYRIKLASAVDPAEAGQRLGTRFPSAGWEIQDRSGGAPGTRRFVERMGQFLGLVGLTALVIAGIGVGNGVSAWLGARRGAIAMLKILGGESGSIAKIYLLQITLVALGAILVGLLAGAMAPWIVINLAGNALPVSPQLGVFPVPLLSAAVQGFLIALLFSLAPLARAREVTPASLFRTTVEDAQPTSRKTWLSILILGCAIAALAIVTAYEPKFAAFFILAVIILLAVLGLFGVTVRKVAMRMPRPRTPLLRLALSNLHRPGAQTGRLVIALGLGLTLFATLAFVQTAFDRQIEKAIPVRAPSFFALDIPKVQERAFRQAVATHARDAIVTTVPTLRGPVVALNGKRVAEMKDLPPEAWFLRGDRGLTFARTLPEGSRVTKGAWWPENYAGPPLVSIDERAANAVGLAIGDALTVSVLGREMEAEISSFREISWDTMGFNFVLVFSPGSLEAAPYTLAATIASGEADETGIARAIGRTFPAVSMIRVKDVIVQVADLLRQMARAVATAASVAILSGIAVLVGAIVAGRRARTYDAVLLKLLGGTRGQVLLVQALEYLALALILSVIALGIGAFASWIILRQIFEMAWTPHWPIVLAAIVVGGLGTLLIGLLGSIPILNARSAEALRNL